MLMQMLRLMLLQQLPASLAEAADFIWELFKVDERQLRLRMSRVELQRKKFIGKKKKINRVRVMIKAYGLADLKRSARLDVMRSRLQRLNRRRGRAGDGWYVGVKIDNYKVNVHEKRTLPGWFIYLAQSIRLLFSPHVKHIKRTDNKADWQLSAKKVRKYSSSSCFNLHRTTCVMCSHLPKGVQMRATQDPPTGSLVDRPFWNNRYRESGSKIQGHGGHVLFPLLALSVAWLLFIGLQDTPGMEQGRGAIVVTSRWKVGKKKKQISNLSFRTFLSPPKCKIERTRLTPPGTEHKLQTWFKVLFSSCLKITSVLYPIIEANKVRAIKRSDGETKTQSIKQSLCTELLKGWVTRLFACETLTLVINQLASTCGKYVGEFNGQIKREVCVN